MIKNPQDRRALRTAAQIKTTMLALMEKKSIHEISVAEICRLCQINRATFYDHYRDVFDLVQSMESEVLADLHALMEQVSPEPTPAGEVSRLFFQFLAAHRRVLVLLTASERSTSFIRRLDTELIAFFEKKVRQSYHIPQGMDKELEAALRFASMGYYSFYLRLLETDGEVPPDAALCDQFSDACLSTLFQRKA